MDLLSSLEHKYGYVSGTGRVTFYYLCDLANESVAREGFQDVMVSCFQATTALVKVNGKANITILLKSSSPLLKT